MKPQNPEIRIDTTRISPQDAAELIVAAAGRLDA
jgi:adenylylsulfate kinase-like enzyme